MKEVVILEHGRECRASSRNSHLAAQSLNDIWRCELKLPRFPDMNTRSLVTDQMVISGGWRRWETLSNEDKGTQEDSLWKSTPRRVWEVVVTELFDHVADQIPGAPGAATPGPTRSAGGRDVKEEEELETRR